MAATLVGGAVLSSVFNVLFDRMSSPEALNWMRAKKLDKKLETLKTTLFAAQAFLNDADKRHINETPVRDWLDSLKDAVYKADDLLDEVATKAATQKNETSGNIFSRFLNSQDREMANKMDEVIDALESILKHKDALGLKEIPKEDMSWRISTSLLEGSDADVYGREEDKEAIIKLLLDDTHHGDLSVIPIVGLGGIGKTTLAQLVFNDERVKRAFDFQAWSCVSEEFEVVKITRAIMEAVDRDSCKVNELDLLQRDLKEKLLRRKFFVVLDDVWNKSKDDLTKLLKPFQQAVKGSKILITTRSTKVALMVQTAPPHRLSVLSDEDSWLVFTKHALLSADSLKTLEEIGRKIVSKCNGLPLAVKTLGGLLRGNHDEKYWNHVLKNEIWKFSEEESKIVPSLRISYHYLPSCLKECFIYCSLYPKDYQFKRHEIILSWMAQDLLQESKTQRTLEDVGDEYFDELFARSFFQPYNIDKGLYVMHDLMHDLATCYAGEFYFRAEELGSAFKVDSKIRHLLHNAQGNYPISKLLEVCNKLKHTRTFLEINLPPWQPFEMQSATCILLSQLKYLRFLSFQRVRLPDDSLPDSVGELIHLRYLDLSHTFIVTLPESIGNLYNLQTLKLMGCHELFMLPSRMQDLVNLRHLDIRGTCLYEMPKGMRKLKDLQFLSDFVVGEEKENGTRELGALANIHGELRIAKLENVIKSEEALEARMVDKKHIDDLCLQWSSDGNVANSQTERDILSNLRPHSSLKVLSIEGYRGTIFPEWLDDSSYCNMTHLYLKGCNNCWELSSLGQLPSLKVLEISKFEALKIIGAKFYKNDDTLQGTPFPSLEILKFKRMGCWQEWSSIGFNAFPRLKKLEIGHCDMLRGGLPDQLPALEEFTITGCSELACFLPRTPAILELHINGTGNVRMQEVPLSLHTLTISGKPFVEDVLEALTHTQLTCLQHLSIWACDSAISFPWDCMPALKHLRIGHCRKLELAIQEQQQHESLKSLEIFESCDSLISFPLAAFPNLTKLHIHYNKQTNLVLVPSSQGNVVSNLRQLNIANCPRFASLSTLSLAAPQLESLRVKNWLEIDSFTEGSLPPSLRHLTIFECEELVRWIESTDLRAHPLTSLRIIEGSDSIKSFPKECLLPASLESLELRRLQSMETLDCNGLVHLTFLKVLIINDCPKLQNLAGEMLPASLTTLDIDGWLAECYRNEDPQIWPKVSHIPTIRLQRYI